MAELTGSVGSGRDGPAPGPSIAPPRPPRLRPNGPIVRAEDIAVWGEAREALAAARRHAEAVRARAAEAAEGDRRRAREEGRAAGAEEAARLVAETAARATEHLESLERDLPALVHGIVAGILAGFDDGDAVVRAVRRAVDGMRPGAEATLRVSPADADAVAGALSGLPGRAAVRIEADPALRPGEACLRSALGSVEVGVAAQLRALGAALGVVPPGAADRPDAAPATGWSAA